MATHGVSVVQLPLGDLDTSALVPFTETAAGHDGVLSDLDGELIIKPCTQAEIDFYEQTMQQHRGFVKFMPDMIGSLRLGAPQASAGQGALVMTDGAEHAINNFLNGAHPSRATTSSSAPSIPQSDGIGRGTKIDSDLAIVLENLERPYKKANVLDIKLGSQLYDPATTPFEKAARLDQVSATTTSGSLNFRIAGAKVYNNVTRTYQLYDKHYGRQLTSETVGRAIEEILGGFTASDSSSGPLEPGLENILLEELVAALRALIRALERLESRFYSSSVLIVYEGHHNTLQRDMGDLNDAHFPQNSAEDTEDVSDPNYQPWQPIDAEDVLGHEVSSDDWMDDADALPEVTDLVLPLVEISSTDGGGLTGSTTNGVTGHVNGMNGHGNEMNGYANGMNGHANGMNGHANGMDGRPSWMNGPDYMHDGDDERDNGDDETESNDDMEDNTPPLAAREVVERSGLTRHARTRRRRKMITAVQIRMIDFAHASWTPGRGPDLNVIKGLDNLERSIYRILLQRRETLRRSGDDLGPYQTE